MDSRVNCCKSTKTYFRYAGKLADSEHTQAAAFFAIISLQPLYLLIVLPCHVKFVFKLAVVHCQRVRKSGWNSKILVSVVFFEVQPILFCLHIVKTVPLAVLHLLKIFWLASWQATIGALNGVIVGGHIINVFLLPKKGTSVLHNSNSKLLENQELALNCFIKVWVSVDT